MKTKQYVAGLVLMFGFVVSSYGQCLVQETTIMHINGVNTGQPDTYESSRLLFGELLKQPGINPECISEQVLYNISATLTLDLIEAGIQKAQELNRELPDFWKVYFRVLTSVTEHEFLGVISNWYSVTDLTGYVVDSQLQKHIALVRNELAQGRQVVVVPHSQGTLYANAIWDALTPDEQSQVYIVAVATPSDTVEGGGSYVTLTEDGIARLFAFALPANASNDEVCPSEWYCHGFQEWYLTGHNSHDRIIDDIVSLLPVESTIDPCAVEGVIQDFKFQVISNGKILLRSSIAPYTQIAEYPADVVGNYCIPHTDVSDGNYRIEAYVGNQLIESRVVTVSSDSTWFANFPTPVLM